MALPGAWSTGASGPVSAAGPLGADVPTAAPVRAGTGDAVGPVVDRSGPGGPGRVCTHQDEPHQDEARMVRTTNNAPAVAVASAADLPFGFGP